MTRRFVAGFAIALMLVVSPAVGAQRGLETSPGHVTITTNQNTTLPPIRLVSENTSEVFDAQAQTLQVKYAAEGMTVVMKTGSYTATATTATGKTRKDVFGTLTLKFAKNGAMVDFQVER